MRNANIVTTIRLARAARCGWPPATLRGGETNIVTFIPATETNITNPRNGETVAVRGWRLQLKETH